MRARSLTVQLFTEAAARTIVGRLELPSVCQIMASSGNFYPLLPNTTEAEAVLGQVSDEVDSWSLS